MATDGESAKERLARLERTVETSFAKLCQWVRLEHHMYKPVPPESVYTLSQEVEWARSATKQNAERARSAEPDRAEIEVLAKEVDRLRAAAGDAEKQFAERFAAIAPRFSSDDLVSAALKGGSGGFSHESSSPTWLAKHILTTDGLAARMRDGANQVIEAADFEDRVGIRGVGGDREMGLRVLGILDELEMLAKDMDRGQLAAAARLEPATERLESRINQLSPKYGSREWRKWPQALAKKDAELKEAEETAVRKFVTAYLDAQCYEDHETGTLRFECREYRGACHKLDLARLEYRIAALEEQVARLGGGAGLAS